MDEENPNQDVITQARAVVFRLGTHLLEHPVSDLRSWDVEVYKTAIEALVTLCMAEASARGGFGRSPSTGTEAAFRAMINDRIEQHGRKTSGRIV